MPCYLDGKFRTVLDIDSPDVGNFTDVDKEALEGLVELIYPTSK